MAKLITINRVSAERGMTARGKLRFKESLSFGSPTDWPIHLNLYGKRWNFYANFGGSMMPKRASRKAITKISASFPKTEFLRVDAQWEAGTALYTYPFSKY